MTKRILYFIGLFLFLGFAAKAQDTCATASSLCASSTLNRTTVAATTVASDPALSCGDGVVTNSVWFSLLAINNGNCTITVTGIDNNPGLDMEVYTGSCGSFTPTGLCASGSSATGGTMNIALATVAGTTYYIMVDGNTGNQESFDITATTPNDAIVARPNSNFDVNPYSGCIPLSTFFDNNTVLHGGNNITYSWKINTGAFVPSTGADTTIVFSAAATNTIQLKVCNLECGCKTVSQDVVSQNLVPSITAVPSITCVGTPINFTAAASVLPTPPFVNPNVTLWEWNFGDTASGASNNATGQNVSHLFIGPPATYSVRLIAHGTCGPDTTFKTITILPNPIVTINGPSESCEGQTLTLGSSLQFATPAITYTWSGVGTLSCTNCATTNITNLIPGGPYTFSLSIIDNNGCTADTTKDVIVHPRPSVFAGGSMTLCKNDTAQLNAVPSGGYPPYTYQWTPSAGLSSSTIYNPFTFNTNGTSYCVVVSDSNNCPSISDCISLNQYPQPTISSSNPALCTTQPSLQNTFTVNGPNAGSSYSWRLSTSYSLITSAAPDSSSITVTFPPTVGTYNFTAIVIDALTGCKDTVNTSFNITPGLNMTITGPNQMCDGDTITLTASGAVSYSWSASPAYAFSNATAAAQVMSPPSSTVFTITGVAGTCTQIITDTLTVYGNPVATVSPIAPYCGCAIDTLNGVGSTAGMSYFWTSTLGSSIANPTALFTTANICDTDTIMLTVTDTITTCATSASIVVLATPRPDVQVNVTPTNICIGVPTVVTLDGTGTGTLPGTTYDWSSDNPLAVITDTTLISTTANINTPSIFYLLVTNSAGCDSMAQDTVNVFTEPVISSSPPFLCTSDIVRQSTITITGASPTSSYTWTTIPACVTPSTANSDTQLFDFAACGPAVDTFAVSVYDSVTTCTTNLISTVTVVSGVVLVLTPDTFFCEGGVATLNVSGANSFLWSTGDTVQTLVFSNLTAAGSPYTYIVTGTIGSCVASDTVVVTVNPVPVTTPITGLTTVCEGDTSYYHVSPQNGNYTWTLSGGTIVSGQGTDSILIAWDTSGLAFLSVVDTNIYGCAGPLQTMNIVVNPMPDTPTVTGPPVVCQDGIETYFVGIVAGSTYYWSVTGGSFTAGNTGSVNTVQWGAAGPGTLGVYEVSSANCTGPSATYNVTINPRPGPVTIIGNTLVCDNIPEVYLVAANAGSIYTWDVINNASETLNPGTDSLLVNWGPSTAGQVSVFETNTYNCNSDTTGIFVTIIQHPQIILNDDSAIVCNNTAYQIIASANTPNTVWHHDGNGSLSDSTITSPIYTPLITDTGYVHLYMVATNAPCANDTVWLALYITPSPVVTITGPVAPICYGSIDSLRATAGATDTYIWTPGGIPSPIIGIRPLVTTVYTVAVTNSYNCTTVVTYNVDVIPPGIPTAGNDQNVCNGDVITLNGTQINAGGLIWSTSGDGVFNPFNTSSTVTYDPGNNDTLGGSVTIYLTTTGACLNLTDTVILTINQHPYINAGTDTTLTIGAGPGVMLPLYPTSTNVQGVIWTTSGTGSFTPSDTTLNAVYVPSKDDFNKDSIVITVTTVGSCLPVSDYLVIDFSPLEIPNVFTPYPSSPGQNDYFVVKHLVPNVTLQVWDRWGMLVYKSDYYQNDWDANGLKSDVYFYVVTSPEKEYKGWVQVLRGE